MTNYGRLAVRYVVRLCLLLVALGILTGLTAPFVNASAFAGPIRNALAASLGRKVAFEEVHFNLFSGPGFSLTGVTIEEDPRYGLEPFAYVPALQARVRLATILRGRLAFSSLRLDNPSLNIVNGRDGTWNIVELIGRLTAPRRLPVDLFPAFSVSGGRLDFKLGTRKTVFYLAATDVNLYPQRSGKLYVQFSGSPARTDRPGTGFGHLRGTANWYLQPGSAQANQLEMDLILDQSNLSELATLVEGHDVGIHGRVSSHATIQGPLEALRINGTLRLMDLHRWDLLLPAAGDDWRVAYQGSMDLRQRTVTLNTLANNPVALGIRIENFSRSPRWATLATFKSAPAEELLPLGRRMGVPLPADLNLAGTVDGAVGYASNGGFSGSLALQHITAGLSNLPPLHAAALVATIQPHAIRFEPSLIDTGSSGRLQVQGNYNMDTHLQTLALQAAGLPIETLRDAIAPWFGTPAAFPAYRFYRGGTISGQITLEQGEGEEPAWTGNLHFQQAELSAPALAGSLTDAEGTLRFDPRGFDIEHFSAKLGLQTLTASYHATLGPTGTETAHVSLPAADWRDLEAALDPTLRAQGLLARLGVTEREVPSWLEGKHLQADVSIAHFSMDGTLLGALETRLIVDGARVQFPTFSIQLADGSLKAAGALYLATSKPRYEFTADINGYRWRGGTLNARGEFRTSGLGGETIENLNAAGTFACDNVNLSPDDVFQKAEGAFQFSFAPGWANLRIDHLEASDDEAWTGNAETDKDGRLIIDLEHEGRQRRVVSSLIDERTPAPSSLLPGPAF